MSFEELQNGRHGGHLGYRNGTILAILYFYISPMPPIKFQLSLTYGLWGGHLKNFKMAAVAAILDNGTISAILNICVTVMPPIRFWLNPTYSLLGDVV